MRESEHERESERERVAGWGANSWVASCEVLWRIAFASCTVSWQSLHLLATCRWAIGPVCDLA